VNNGQVVHGGMASDVFELFAGGVGAAMSPCETPPTFQYFSDRPNNYNKKIPRKLTRLTHFQVQEQECLAWETWELET